MQTSSVKQWFAAHIPSCPEVQAKAHAEIDSVCGRDRLPIAEDEVRMPYVHAIVKVGCLGLLQSRHHLIVHRRSHTGDRTVS